MTSSPATFLEVRKIFQEETKLPAVSLGIQHYQPQGGGYHEGNDLLSKAGRLNTDYSKRETDLDRPGSDFASAIDIGRFRVIRHGVVVDNHFLTRWVLTEIAAGAPDTLWIREIIYSLDDRTVKRYDRLGIRSTGDKSHTSHEHYSAFRDRTHSASIPALFRRFWAWVNAGFKKPETVTSKRKVTRMFLMHVRLSQGQVKFALVGETTVREWNLTDVFTLGGKDIDGQDLANAFAESIGDSAEKTALEYEAIKSIVGRK